MLTNCLAACTHVSVVAIHPISRSSSLVSKTASACGRQLWSAAKRLQLNATKTEILWFGSEIFFRKLSPENRVISVGQSVIQPVTVIRDLGVLIDGELSMGQHVTGLAQTYFFHLRRLRSLRRQLGRDVMARHVWTIVTPYLPDSQRLHWRHYSGYCTLLLELSWTSDHATMCLPPCENCTGCRSSTGSSSSCACSSRSHSLVIQQHT